MSKLIFDIETIGENFDKLDGRAFGIKSPKAEGITGDDVGPLFKDKKFLEIAKYNVGDLKATKELYDYWNNYIRF